MLTDLEGLLATGPKVVASQRQHLPPALLKRIWTTAALKLSLRLPAFLVAFVIGIAVIYGVVIV